MIGNPNKFISLKRDKRGKVTFGDNLSSKIIGKCKVAIRDKMKDKNIFLVKNLEPNLLSVSQTCDQGNEERKVWKKKDDVECSIALCAT